MVLTSKLPPVQMLTAVDSKGRPVNSADIEQSCLKLIALFGITDASKSEKIIKMPQGIEAINIIAEQIMLQETFEKQHQRDLRDAEILRRRALGSLLLSLLYKKDAKAKARIEYALQEIKRINSKSNKSTNKTNSIQTAAYYNQAQEMFENAHKTLSDYLDELNQKAEKLEIQLEDLAKEQEAFEAKYELIEKELEDALNIIQTLDDDQIQDHIEELDKKIPKLQDKIAQGESEGKDMSRKFVKLTALTAKLAKLESYKHDDFYTAEGELIQSHEKKNRCQDAQFTIKPDLKLVIHNNQFMVIKKGTNPENLSEEQREQAVKNFQNQKGQYTEIQKLCAINKVAESGLLSTKAEKLATSCVKCNNRISFVLSQLPAIREGCEQVNQSRQSQQTKPTTSTSPQPRPSQTAQSYRNMLMLMGSQPPNPTQLMTVAKGLGNSKLLDNQLKKALVQRLEEAGITKSGDNLHTQLISKGPIQTQTLRELQERVNQRPTSANPQQLLTPFSIKPKKPF